MHRAGHSEPIVRYDEDIGSDSPTFESPLLPVSRLEGIVSVFELYPATSGSE